MYGGKFAFQNRLGWPYFWKEIYCFSLFYFVLQDNFQVQAPRGVYIWRSDLTEGFLGYEFGGLILGGAYFQNFTVFIMNIIIIVMYKLNKTLSSTDLVPPWHCDVEGSKL